MQTNHLVLRFLFVFTFIIFGCDTSKKTLPLVGVETVSSDEAKSQSQSIDNPQYAAWQGFPVGTTVVLRSVTSAKGQQGETTTTTSYKLIAITESAISVEMQTHTVRYDGHVTKNDPTKYDYPKKLVLPSGVTPKENKEVGDETLKVLGTEYKTKWYKTKDRNEAGEVFTQVWKCDAVPGGILRSVMTTPSAGITSTTELIEIRKP